jgi:hypothetical protein
VKNSNFYAIFNITNFLKSQADDKLSAVLKAELRVQFSLRCRHIYFFLVICSVFFIKIMHYTGTSKAY